MKFEDERVFLPDSSGVSALVSGVCVCFCLNVGALTSVTVGFIEFVHLKSPSVTYISLTINVIHKCQGSIMWNCWKYFACFYYFFPCSKLYPSAKWLIKAVMLCTRCTRILPWLEEFRHSVLIQHISLLNTMTSSSLVLLWKDSKYDIQWIIKSINNNNIKLPCNYLINRIVNLTCSFKYYNLKTTHWLIFMLCSVQTYGTNI